MWLILLLLVDLGHAVGLVLEFCLVICLLLLSYIISIFIVIKRCFL